MGKVDYDDIMDPISHDEALDLSGCTERRLRDHVLSNRVTHAWAPGPVSRTFYSRASVLRLVARGLAPGPNTPAGKVRKQAREAAQYQEHLNRVARRAAAGLLTPND